MDTSPSPTSGTDDVPSAAGQRLTASADGTAWSLTIGQTAELAPRDAEPSVEGTAVVVFRTTEFAGDGTALYEVRAVETGTAVVTFAEASITILVR